MYLVTLSKHPKDWSCSRSRIYANVCFLAPLRVKNVKLELIKRCFFGGSEIISQTCQVDARNETWTKSVAFLWFRQLSPYWRVKLLFCNIWLSFFLLVATRGASLWTSTFLKMCKNTLISTFWNFTGKYYTFWSR